MKVQEEINQKNKLKKPTMTIGEPKREK